MSDHCSHLWKDSGLQREEQTFILQQECWKCSRERVLAVPERCLPADTETSGGHA